MTTIITRLFPDEATAQSAAKWLQFKGIPKRQCDIIVAGKDAKNQMKRAQVHDSAIAPYTKRLSGDTAVLVVRTTYKPLGAARITREVLERRETIDVGQITDDFYVPTGVGKQLSILDSHPHMLTLPGFQMSGPVTAAFGMPMLKPRKVKRNLSSPAKRMSRLFWPMPLVSQKERSKSVMRGTRHMSKMFWPAKLISNKPRRKSVIPDGGLPFSRLLGLRTVS